MENSTNGNNIKYFLVTSLTFIPFFIGLYFAIDDMSHFLSSVAKLLLGIAGSCALLSVLDEIRNEHDNRKGIIFSVFITLLAALTFLVDHLINK